MMMMMMMMMMIYSSLFGSPSRCVLKQGVLGKVWSMGQWGIFSFAALGMFAISLVRNTSCYTVYVCVSVSVSVGGLVCYMYVSV